MLYASTAAPSRRPVYSFTRDALNTGRQGTAFGPFSDSTRPRQTTTFRATIGGPLRLDTLQYMCSTSEGQRFTVCTTGLVARSRALVSFDVTFHTARTFQSPVSSRRARDSEGFQGDARRSTFVPTMAYLRHQVRKKKDGKHLRGKHGHREEPPTAVGTPVLVASARLLSLEREDSPAKMTRQCSGMHDKYDC